MDATAFTLLLHPEDVMSSTAVLERMDQAEVTQLVAKATTVDLRPAAADQQKPKLLAELAVIGVLPFRQDTVDAYKALKLAEFKRKVHASPQFKSWGAMTLACAWTAHPFLAFFAAVSTASAAFEKGGFEVETAKWKTDPLLTNEAGVPARVLETAARIKDAIPGAVIYVDTLVTTREKVLDPFLGVRKGSESYRVEVWDEPEFDGGAEV